MKSLFNKYYNIAFPIVKSYYAAVITSTKTLLKWLAYSCICGGIIGVIGALFHHLLTEATIYRQNNPWLIFLLPVAGIVIVFLYKLSGDTASKGTNLVISAIHSNEKVPVRIAPLIIISTFLTHMFGGSAGREGAALQVGGSIGDFFADIFKADEKDTRILIMCGMSSCFSALFGTPIAAAVFSMEVISVGIMHYSALVPCVVAALIANEISSFMQIEGTHFDVGEIPALSLINGSKMLILAVAFACASILLCLVLHKTSQLYQKFIKNHYLRIIVAGLLIIALRYICGTTDYLGAGTDVIARSFVTSCAWYVFILKIVFTAITLGGGFKGGEIVPAMFVGATLGSLLAPIFGLPIALCAACGMVSVFCGATNCPLTSIIISVEMFGGSSLVFCALCISVSYLLSGYFSLYSTQKFVYSKYKPEFIDRESH